MSDKVKRNGFTIEDIAIIKEREIAEAFGGGKGIQIELGTIVKWYEKLGLLKEIK